MQLGDNPRIQKKSVIQCFTLIMLMNASSNNSDSQLYKKTRTYKETNSDGVQSGFFRFKYLICEYISLKQ